MLTPVPGCGCHFCVDYFRSAYVSASALTLYPMVMILCPDCGNKRCPKANYHGYACTRSNDTGQEGSAYP